MVIVIVNLKVEGVAILVNGKTFWFVLRVLYIFKNQLSVIQDPDL